MRYVRSIYILILLFVLAFSAEARRRPSSCCRPAPKFVKVALGEIVGETSDHQPFRWVLGLSTEPLIAGTNYDLWVQKPGETAWTYMRSRSIDPGENGFSIVFSLMEGNEFYDVLPDGSKRYWNPGVGTYRIDAQIPDGEKVEKISSFTKVEVGSTTTASATFGPLQSIVPSLDGRSLQLIGIFPTPPVVVFVEKVFVETLGTVVYLHSVKANANNVVQVPERVSGAAVPIFVGSGYPSAEFSTREVAIPPPPANAHLESNAVEADDVEVFGPFVPGKADSVVIDAQPLIDLEWFFTSISF